VKVLHNYGTYMHPGMNFLKMFGLCNTFSHPKII